MKKILPAIFVLTAATLWGCMGWFARQLNAASLYAMEVVELRVVVGILCVGTYLALFHREKLRIRLRDLWCFVGTGLCSLLFFSWCYFTGMRHTSLSVMGVLLYTAPVFVMLMSAVLFREKLTLSKVVALLMTVVGCTLVAGIVSGEPISSMGLVMGLCAGFGYALYSIFSRYAIERGYDSWTITFYTFAFCAAAGVFLTDWQAISAAFAAKPSLWALTAVMGALTAFAPYILYTKGLEGMESSRASILASVEPVVAAIIGTLVFHEAMSAQQLLGIVLILGGIVVLQVRRKA